MDMRRVGRVLTQAQTNSNSSQPFHLTSSLLEVFVPGYGFVSKVVLDTFGFDIGVLVPIVLFLLTFYTSTRFFWRNIVSLFSEYCVAYIYFDDHDDLFGSVLAWIALQQVTKKSRRLKAISKYGSKSEDDSILEDVKSHPLPNELFHFAKLAGKTPPKYEPAIGQYYFIWQRRLFIFERSRRERQTISYNNQPDEEVIRLKTIGFSAEPIKDLLQHIKKWSVERKTSKTTIRRPAPKERRGYHQNPWSVTTTRHSRPMNTVVLDKAQKDVLVADINEFLSPTSPQWYATRGIPYRRGYLFHGPPGTGKSSLSFALAGLFGLDIHVISLLESTLTEADLNHMFNTLPKRCIVLLEDIDTAGLKRDATTDGDAPADNEPTSVELNSKNQRASDMVSFSAADLAKELRRVNRAAGGRDNSAPPQGVSLSGLLNAIDGVASHEGRVLVMTTNHPEKLDIALIRPGRVDMKIEFGLATRHQMEEIFFRMYWSDDETHDGSRSTTPTMERASMDEIVKGDVEPPVMVMGVHGLNKEEVRSMAKNFAELVPEGKISPAEIQNFLIARKKDPRKSLAEVEAWQQRMLDYGTE